jgi:hypothetical protein
MASIKTANFLPEVFRTDNNRKFLGATLDQLVTPPDLRKVNAYVGRKFAPTYQNSNNYQPESSGLRQNYQLEPSVVVKNKTGTVDFFSSYIDLINQIAYSGGITDDHSRLFATETYSFDGLFDFDKFVNFNQYYWLTNGPATVDVFGAGVDQTQTFTVTRDAGTGSYHFSGSGTAKNPALRLARGGTYKFVVNQPGYPFWIQSSAGTSGLKNNQSNLSSRDILGIENNGTDVGTVTFRVPQATAQDYYVYMKYPNDDIVSGTVDASTELHYSQIQGATLSQLTALGGLDGVRSQLLGKTFIFINQDIDDLYWTAGGLTIPRATRRNVWQIQAVDPLAADPVINLISVTNVLKNQKIYVSSGQNYAEYSFYLDLQFLTYKQIPNITAPLDTIYYQDGASAGYVGQLNLVNINDNTLKVDDDIVGKSDYTSPNGVVFTNGLKIQFDASAVPATYANRTYYVEGVGTAIQLLPETDFVTPEPYAVNGIASPDYITINRASQDLNPWTRSNRWFHIDVIKAAAEYNNDVPVFDQNVRANRPIIEFEADLQLYNFGRVAKTPVDIFDLTTTDARNTVELSTTFQLNGVSLQNGQRVIFANDFDPTVRNQIFIISISEINQTPVVTLSPAEDSVISTFNNLIVLQGNNRGVEYWFDGSDWIVGQQKTGVNQTPMFDVYDNNGISIGDTDLYPLSTFATATNNLGTVVGGTKIFSYRTGTGVNDQILGFPLSYRTFNQVGDIQFNNDFDTDVFSYTLASTATTENIHSLGTLRKNSGLVNGTARNTWTKVVEPSRQYQIISGVYNGVNRYFEIDIRPEARNTIPYFKVFKNFTELTTAQFQVVSAGVKLYVKITDPDLVTDDKIDILIYSKTVSALGHYQVPDNLNFNTENANFASLTLGQLRNHLVTLVSNSNQVTGSAFGDNNLRDRPIKAQGGNILQNAGPVLYSELFLVDPEINFLKGLELARHNYGRIKNKILESAIKLKNINTDDIPGMLDAILLTINGVKNNSFPWYYSDMVPYGPLKNTITYKVIEAEQTDYEITNIFVDTKLSNQSVLVYVNNVQLTKGTDYVFDTTRAGITFKTALAVDDVITINEYSNTDGNYIPDTPTKLGLYPKFTPKIYLDETYVTPINVIQGHDGSVTPAFNDFRDQLLLEFELRIYNNIKIDTTLVSDNIYNTVPGKFRETDYSLAEFTRLLSKSFLQWVGANRVDFTSNTYFVGDDPFTWNFARFVDTVNGEALPGTWRAIYQYFYDTVAPNTAPWEMLGFSEEPEWWETRYGVAPYTGGNLVMWGDLEVGYVWNNGDSYTDTRFARPGLLSIIPVDENGNLRNPAQFLVKSFNSNQANGSYAVGQQGPVETAWRRSSDYPYAVQEAIALAKPGYFFGTLMDVTRYYKNTTLDQYTLSDSLQRITPGAIHINGESSGSGNYRVAGYINWIADYLRSQGIEPVSKITGYLDLVTVQLAYKMAGYSDKSFLQVLAEQASPTSTTNSVVIPAENYTLELYKSTPVKTVTYSAVIVEKSENGYTVSGYDTGNPYFTIIPSLANNNAYPITVLNDTGIVYQDYQKYKITVPYGFEFTNKQQVVDFLISYERYLVGSGFVFADKDPNLETQRDFKLSVQEFLAWSQQGWAVGTVMILSPVLNHLTVNNTQGVIDKIENAPLQSRILDPEFNFIKYNELTVSRTDNVFTLTAISGRTIALAVLDVVEYEHVLIFDNVTVFNDVIYAPKLGNRQYRLKLVGQKTGAWTGALNPPGFVYNSAAVDAWQPGVDYLLGSLVVYKNTYYTNTQNLTATTTFVPAQWKRLAKNQIQTGLLPNFSYNAGKSLRYNNFNDPELQGDFANFVGNEVGFTPRQYLTNFGIDTPTQAKFYQGFIRQKGTLNSVTAFTAAGFNGVSSTVNLYEDWAMRVGEFGALNNNRYVELILSEGVFTGEPAVFNFLNNGATTTDNIVAVYPDDIYRSSKGYSPAIFKDRDNSSFYENDLLTAGYVNVADVDAQIFNIQAYGQLNSQLANVAPGYKIWAARDNITTSWQVYRVNETNVLVNSVFYNVDYTVTVTTTRAHGSVRGDYVVIKGFDGRVDGFYQVSSVVDNYRFNIIIDVNSYPVLKSAGTITGLGVLYRLQSLRIKTATDLNAITPLNQWQDGDKLWVDQDQNTAGWVVYNKSTPWVTSNASVTSNPLSMQLDANSYISNSGFGTVSTINQTGTFAAASMPNLGKGNVIAFVSNISNGYNFTMVANLGAPVANSVSLFGASLDSAGNLLYVGNPGNGSTEYGRTHIHKFDATGTPTVNTTAVITALLQASVDIEPAKTLFKTTTVGGRPLGDINNSGTLSPLDALYYGQWDAGTNTDPGQISWITGTLNPYILANPTNYGAYLNYFFTLSQTLSSPFTGNIGDQFGYSVSASSDSAWLYVGAPGAGNVYVYHANANGYYSYANTITGNSYVTSGNAILARFGLVVNTTSEGDYTAVGAPGETVAGVSSAGAVYTFNRSQESFVATGNTAYYPQYPITASTLLVTVNGNVVTTGYTSNSSAVTFTAAPVVGTTITVDTNKIQLVKKLTETIPGSGNQFGTVVHIAGNDADVYASSPGYNEVGYHSGVVYRFANYGANYGTATGNVYDPVVTVGDNLYINGRLVTFGANATGSLVGNLQSIVANINSANIPGITATAQDYGLLTLTSNVAIPYKKLLITPGTGTALANIGLDVYTNVQSIKHPGAADVNSFGSQLTSSVDSTNLIISASRGQTNTAMTFDQMLTRFDAEATSFSDTQAGSGVVYIYGLVEGSLTSSTLDQYVLVQQLQNNAVSSNDQLGSGLSMNVDTILVGAPGDSNHLTTDSVSQALTSIPNAGTYYTYKNISGNVGWDIISSEQPRVDIDSITRMYIYNNVTDTLLTNFDHIDPVKGKLLGIAEQDLDYITAYDPAVYNAGGGPEAGPLGGASPDFHWGAAQVGKTWWDTSLVRYVDYEQGNLTYRANHWGEMFPGSTVQVCEWVESSVVPDQYTGSGVPLYTEFQSYVEENYVDTATKVVRTRYYFWVKDKTTVETNSTRRNSVKILQEIIANPTAQSVPYAAVLRNDAVALYNIGDYLTGAGNTVVFHADTDALTNTNIIHNEWQLVQEGNSNSLIPDRIVEKMIDSLAGVDRYGNTIPAVNLSPQTRIGLDFTQTVFVDRMLALKNFVEYVNNVMIQHPIVEQRNINNLYSAEAQPDITEYDLAIASRAELDYINTATLLSNYTVLVIADETQNELWTMHTWTGTAWSTVRTQSYYTPFYWSFADWYDSTYNSSDTIKYSANTYADLASLTPTVNDSARVANRGNGEFAVYRYNGTMWDLVGLENGTVQFDSTLYTSAVAGNEIRILFETVRDDIFVDTLIGNFNGLFFYLINYILTEQKSVDWIFKTSFVTVLHQLKKLEQFPAYIQDNQTYYENYINEVKPYRTSIREYLINYQGSDAFSGDITDFDIPATYIANINAYRSPDGSLPSDSYSLTTLPQYSQWNNNHSYSINAVTVSNSGANYYTTPTITVIGGGGTGATVEAVLDVVSNTIARFDVVNAGSGYTSTPTIQINGSGINAAGYPKLVSEQYITSVPLQTITLVGNAVVYVGNIITQPLTGASGVAYTASTGNIITLKDVVGTFVSNQWLFSDSSNLSIRPGVATVSMKLTGNLSAYTGNIITQPASGARAEVYSDSSGKVVSLWNYSGTFIGNAYLYRNGSNLNVRPAYYTVSSVPLAVPYTTFVDQSYNKVRTFTTHVKFDRTSYSSNISAWKPNITVTANSRVSYQGSAYQANSTVYSSATLKLTANVSANVGDYITQSNNSTANARIISIASNSLITVANLSGNFIRRTGNIVINGVTSIAAPISVTNIFDYGKYSLLATANLTNASDRITAAYQPGSGMPSLDLAQLMSGIEYPGVQVQGVKFGATTSNISSNVLYYYSSTSTLYSSNLALIDFTMYGLQPKLPVSVVNNDTGFRSNVTILNITPGSIFLVGSMPDITLGSNVSIVYYDYNDPAYLDTNIQSFYNDSALGTRPEDINVDGGRYYDTYSSHAPEELVPGITFDSLNMAVYTQIGAANVGYRIVHNMNTNAASTDISYWPQYYAIRSVETSPVLTANLNLTDTDIYVSNAGLLQTPDAAYAVPGVIYINGEKIVYYTVDIYNNVLGQIRRAVDGTGAPAVHPAGSLVSDASAHYRLPSSSTGSANVHLSSWLNLSTSSYPQEFLTLSANATVFAGNTVTQFATGASGIVAANSTGTTIALWAANITGTFSANISANTYVYRNGSNLSAKTTGISYTVVDGSGLAGSSTTQAEFIKSHQTQ